MWKCSKCGTENEGNFCNNCGSGKPDENFDGNITINYKLKNDSSNISDALAEKKSSEKKKKIKPAMIALISVLSVVVLLFVLIFSLYFSAKSDLKNSKFDNAIKKFEKVSFFADSKNMINECIYSKAKSLISSKEYASAVNELESILGYKDSEKVLISCYINMLDVYKKSEDYKSASELISSIDESLITDEIFKYGEWCDYAYAKSLIEKEPDKALELLKQYDSDYEDVDDLILECHYLLAKKYCEDEEYELAYREFENCIDYKDSEYLQSSLNSEIVKLAIGKYDSGDYEKSVELFEMCNKGSGENSDEILAYKLFLSYKTDKYQRPAMNNRLFSYVGSYTAARKIVLEDESIFADFIKGTWSDGDDISFEFSPDFSVKGSLSGKCKLEGGKLSVNSGEGYAVAFSSIEIFNETKIKVVLASTNASCSLSKTI